MKDKIDMAADIPQSILANKDLIPSQQTWSWYNIFAFWMSDVHSAGGYIFAGTLFSLGLAGWQVFISLIAGILIILVLANIIGVPSQKFAIPFPVISRMTYGVFGSNIPALIRGIIAIVWYGIQTYLASAALIAMGAKIIYTGTSELRTPEVVRQKLIKMNANFEEHFDLTMKQNEELYAEKNVDLIYLPGCSVKKDDPNRADFEKKMANYYVSLEMLRNIKAKTGKTVGVHHSLPRNPGEFDFGIDNTEHQLYFRAIGFSVALRMALLAAVVGVN